MHNVYTMSSHPGRLRGRCSFIYVCLVVCEQCCELTRTSSVLRGGVVNAPSYPVHSSARLLEGDVVVGEYVYVLLGGVVAV